jgi:hypothetical protein
MERNDLGLTLCRVATAVRAGRAPDGVEMLWVETREVVAGHADAQRVRGTTARAAVRRRRIFMVRTRPRLRLPEALSGDGPDPHPGLLPPKVAAR